MTDRIFTFFLSCCLTLLVPCAWAQQVHEPQNTDPDWSRPYPPFRIVGNLYYVGSYELACYLITSNEGHILINTGLANSAALIQKNIESLGFKLADIKILLTTQAHYDHVGAMATIKAMTGAQLMANEKDAPVLADGGNSDYAFGGHGSLFQPVKVDRMLNDADTIRLGEMQLILLHHPGHTKGSCSFLFTVNDDQTAYRVLIANLPGIVVDKPFGSVTSYPAIADDYRYTLSAMKNISFDIWLASHASQFNLHKKHQPTDAYDPSAFSDREGYDRALQKLEMQFQKHGRK